MYQGIQWAVGSRTWVTKWSVPLVRGFVLWSVQWSHGFSHLSLWDWVQGTKLGGPTLTEESREMWAGGRQNIPNKASLSWPRPLSEWYSLPKENKRAASLACYYFCPFCFVFLSHLWCQIRLLLLLSWLHGNHSVMDLHFKWSPRLNILIAGCCWYAWTCIIVTGLGYGTYLVAIYMSVYCV